jgi:hypothetical protein
LSSPVPAFLDSHFDIWTTFRQQLGFDGLELCRVYAKTFRDDGNFGRGRFFALIPDGRLALQCTPVSEQ